jgi:hypothetical protein
MLDNNAIRARGAVVPKLLSLTIARVLLSEMDRAVQAALSRIAEGRFQRSIGHLDLARIYEIEPPAGGAHLFKVLLYSSESSPGDSVLITNVADGWNSLCHLIEKEHRAYQIQIISTGADIEFPQNRLETWMDGESKRVVMVMRDSDNWIFFQKGRQEPFEDTELYKARTKRKRLDREIIIEYMKLAGYDLTNDSFWRTSGEAIYYEEQWKTKGPAPATF